jgi:hypothetical protein
VRRRTALTLGLCVPLLAGFAGRAFADGLKPEPAPPPPSSLQPDPAPSARQVPDGGSPSSASTARSSLPVVVTPTTQAAVAPPPAAVRPAAPAPKRSSHTGSAVHRFVRLPGLLLGRATFRTIGGQAAAASTSHESRLLLTGGLALVLLVLGETTFLALAGARLGLRPSGRPRRLERRGFSGVPRRGKAA